MCQIGDIILVDKYDSNGESVSKHSFIVLDDKNGKIQGVSYDLVCLVMSSFKDENQKKKKMQYPGNFPIVADDVDITSGKGNSKSGYVKAEQLYYFDKHKIRYKVIGSIKEDIFNLLVEFIQELKKQGIEFEQITDNLQ